MSTAPDSVATGETLQLDIRVSDDMWQDLFDKIEVFRSRSGPQGPFDEITGPAWSPAQFVVPSKSYVINTKVLSLLVAERTQIDITFTGSDPIASSSLATQVTVQGLGLIQAAVTSAGLSIQTMAPGAVATLRALSSDGAAILGIPTIEPDSVAFGQDTRPTLTLGKELYPFTDPNGDSSFYYKIRFANSLTLAVSEFSSPFRVSGVAGIDASNMVSGKLDLVDAQGQPLANVRVLAYTRLNTLLVEGKAVAGFAIEQLTDESGHAEFLFVRGTPLTVAIAGTNIARDIIVPTDPAISSFNMLDPNIAGPDVFTVQVPNIDYAVRRSL